MLKTLKCSIDFNQNSVDSINNNLSPETIITFVR